MKKLLLQKKWDMFVSEIWTNKKIIIMSNSYQRCPGYLWWEQTCWGRTELLMYQREAWSTETKIMWKGKFITFWWRLWSFFFIGITCTDESFITRPEIERLDFMLTSNVIWVCTVGLWFHQTWMTIFRALTFWSEPQASFRDWLSSSMRFT